MVLKLCFDNVALVERERAEGGYFEGQTCNKIGTGVQMVDCLFPKPYYRGLINKLVPHRLVPRKGKALSQSHPNGKCFDCN